MSVQTEQGYCKYCGSKKIVRGERTNTVSNNKIFKPEVGIGTEEVNASVSLGSIGRYEGKKFIFSATQCQTCFNTNVESSITPVELCPANERPVVIVPNLLLTRLLASRYDLEKIYKLIVSINRRLVTILTKWSKQGRNPCKNNHVGYKITIPILQNLKIDCWVIVDQLDTKLAFRISYGGEDIECP